VSNARVPKPPGTMTISGCGTAESGRSAIMYALAVCLSCTAGLDEPRTHARPGRRETYRADGVERGDPFGSEWRCSCESALPQSFRNCPTPRCGGPGGGNQPTDRLHVLERDIPPACPREGE